MLKYFILGLKLQYFQLQLVYVFSFEISEQNMPNFSPQGRKYKWCSPGILNRDRDAAAYITTVVTYLKETPLEIRS